MKTFNTVLKEITEDESPVSTSSDVATAPSKIGKKKKKVKEEQEDDNETPETIEDSIDAIQDLLEHLDKDEIDDVIDYILDNYIEIQDSDEYGDEIEEMKILKVHRDGKVKRIKTADKKGFKVDKKGKVTKINKAKQLIALRRRAKTLRTNKNMRNHKANIKRKKTMRKFGM